jgi:hypothetical protein
MLLLFVENCCFLRVARTSKNATLKPPARVSVQMISTESAGLQARSDAVAVHTYIFPAISDCCRQDYHVTLSAVQVPCQGPLELYQQAHAVVATGRPARAAIVDNSTVL